MAESSNLKVSVWNVFAPNTSLIMASAEEVGADASTSNTRELPAENSGLHNEVYGWRMAEDPFGGIVDDDERLALKQLLHDALSIDIQPTKRSIDVLRVFVEKSREVIRSGRVEWSGSQNSTQDDEEHRLNSLLIFTNHLSWLVDIFEEHPGVSVSVR